ncbi:MAG: hypothetical protein KBD83_08545 [Gammaproteobacteria bacterium]|nr:hypothetical protein [Gammaproteobacteria bacterium]
MTLKVSEGWNAVHINFYRETGNQIAMQIVYFAADKIYEVSEHNAGEKENELHIFKQTPNLKTAIRFLLRGNKQPVKEIYI